MSANCHRTICLAWLIMAPVGLEFCSLGALVSVKLHRGGEDEERESVVTCCRYLVLVVVLAFACVQQGDLEDFEEARLDRRVGKRGGSQKGKGAREPRES